MDRRLFLARLGSWTATLGIGGLGLTLSSCGDGSKPDLQGPARLPPGLQQKLAHLADAEFSEYAAQRDPLELYAELLNKGVFSEGGEYRQEGLARAVRLEVLRDYQGFFYTETELQLYALSLLLR